MSNWESVTQLHQCDVCGRTAPWGDGWQSYGSIRIDEECGCRMKTCSPECRQHSRTPELINEFTKNHK